jgi:Ca2+/Na+ antiporter
LSEKGNVSQALNIILAVLLLAALAITVYAINQARSLQSEAKGKPTEQKVNLRKLAKTATMTVSPTTVAPAGAEYTVSGTGLVASSLVYFTASTPGCCLGDVGVTDTSGNFTHTRISGHAGTYNIRAFQRTDNDKMVEMAEVSFVVK